MRRTHYLPVIIAWATALGVALAQAPIPGPNVNMVSGTTWPGGDPFLERQNEPTIAVSTRNPLHLLAGSNDYSTVQLGLVTDRVTGDAWLRFYRSTDGGLTWRSTLLAGCPYSTPECMGSPVRDAGYQVGADPTIRAGSNGMFYFNFIAFNRGDNAPGAVALARFIDDNNSDRAGAEPIRYLGTTIIATNTSGRLTDKPWMAVDIPRPGAPTCSIPGTNGTPTQPIPAGNVYVAYAIIQGNDLNTRAKVYVATSTNCGATFGKLIKVTEGSAIAQGAAVAVDPRPAPLGGAVYVAWRQLQLQSNVNQPDAIMIVKSTDGGATFTKPAMVAQFAPFDQGASLVSFRTDSFPAMAVDETGRVYLVWQARVGPPASVPAAEKDARIVLSTSTDGGATWSTPTEVDPIPNLPYHYGRGHQFMPSIAIVAGKVMVGYFDSRDDHTVGRLVCNKAKCNADEFEEVRDAEATEPPSSPLVFNQFLADAPPATYPPLKRRHTVDYRLAQANSGTATPTFKYARVSQFLYGSPSTNGGPKPIQQLRFNVPNLAIFQNNSKGFIGDYTDAAALSMLPTPSGWVFNTTPSDAVVFHEVWTSNHDIRPPFKSSDWLTSSPPTYTGPYDPNLTRPTCTDPNRTGMKNQNIYTSRITQGLEVGAIQNAKKIATTDPNSPAFQRKFVVFVRNTKNRIKSYHLSIALPLPTGVTASFQQTGPPVTALDASIAPRSTVSQTVFVSSTDLTNSSPRVTVNVVENNALPGGCDQTCLSGSIVLNADLTNTDLTNTDLTNTDLTNADLTNTDLTNTDLTNTDLTNTDLTNTDLTNTDLTNMGIPATDLTNADLTNTDLTNTDLTNADLTNASMADATWKVTNKGSTAASVSIKTLLKGGNLPQGFKAQLILHKSYTIPSVKYSCDPKELTQNVVLANIKNPAFLDPAKPGLITDLTNTDLTNTDLTNAVIPVGAGETVKVTLRFFDPIKSSTPDLCGPGLKPCATGDFNPADEVKPVPVPQTVIPNVPGPAIALVITTMSLPAGTLGAPYLSQTLQAVGGTGTRTWALVDPGNFPGSLSVTSGGVVSLTPTATGTFYFTVKVNDTGSLQQPAQEDTQKVTVTILAPTLSFFTGPSNTTINRTMTPPVQVKALDVNLSPISGLSITLAIGTNPPGNGVLSGAASPVPTDGSGIATFSNLSIDTVGTGYTLVASAPGPASVTSGAFNIVPPVLSFLRQPGNTTVGQVISPAVEVTARDNNNVAIAGLNITMAIGTGGGALSGTTTVATNPSGTATFSDLSINATENGYTLVASAVGPSSATSSAFNIVPVISGSINDPAGDATLSQVTPSPDLIAAWATSAVPGLGIKFSVRFAPLTFNSQTTLAEFVLDTDQNINTGSPGVDSGCVSDAPRMGTDYLVEMGSACLGGTARIWKATGGCNQFALVGTASVTVVADGMDVIVPQSLLGGSTKMNFKVVTAAQLPPPPACGYTGVLDYMTNVGSPVSTIQ